MQVVSLQDLALMLWNVIFIFIALYQACRSYSIAAVMEWQGNGLMTTSRNGISPKDNSELPGSIGNFIKARKYSKETVLHLTHVHEELLNDYTTPIFETSQYYCFYISLSIT